MEFHLSRRKLPAPRYPLGAENAYVRAMRALVRAWRDDVLALCAERLPALLDDAARDRRDADAVPAEEQPQETGWAAVLAVLLLVARNRILARAAEARRVVEEARRAVAAVDRANWRRWLRAAYGLDDVPPDRALAALVSAWEQAAVDAVLRLGDDALARLRAAIIRAVAARATAREATVAAREAMDVEARAEAVARVGAAQLVGQLNQARQRGFGVERFVWRTMRDSRVRDAHRAREGRTHRWSDPGPKPGTEPRCRCHAQPVFPQILALRAA